MATFALQQQSLVVAIQAVICDPKAENSYDLGFYRKSLLTPDREYKSIYPMY